MRRVLLFVAILFLAIPVFADHNININSADKETLMLLNGIGEVKAQAIIDYRTGNGPFETKEEVMQVNGIGTATYNNIKDHITLQGGVSASPAPTPAPSPTPATGSPAPSPTPSPTPLSYVAPLDPSIFADAGTDATVIVGADVEFVGLAYNKKKENLTGLIRYSWNFGDGGSAEGRAVLHRFVYPGRYAVVLQVAQETESASDTVIIDARVAELRLTVLQDGALAIENSSDRDLDLSRWILSAGGSHFALPKGTMILKDATVAFAPETTGLKAHEEISLLYPNGARALFASAASESPPNSLPSAPSPMPENTSSETPVLATAPAAPRRAAAESINAFDDTVVEDESLAEAEAASSSQVAAAAGSPSGSWKWWMSALAVAIAGASSVYVARRYAKKEWTVIEDTSE